MNRLIVAFMLAVLFLVGCSTNSSVEFEKYSGDFYVRMFKDGEQSEEVIRMYETYTKDFAKYKGDELYEAVVGMYNGFEDGRAAEFQVKAMLIMDAK